jgi:hypothetical protein
MHVRPDASRTVHRGKYAVEAAPSLITRLTEHAHAVCWPGLGVRDPLPWSHSLDTSRARDEAVCIVVPSSSCEPVEQVKGS